MVPVTLCHEGLLVLCGIFTSNPDLYSLDDPTSLPSPAKPKISVDSLRYPLARLQNHPSLRTHASYSSLRVLMVLFVFYPRESFYTLIEQRKVLTKPKSDMNFDLGNIHYVPSPTVNTWHMIGNLILTGVMFLV